MYSFSAQVIALHSCKHLRFLPSSRAVSEPNLFSLFLLTDLIQIASLLTQ